MIIFVTLEKIFNNAYLPQETIIPPICQIEQRISSFLSSTSAQEIEREIKLLNPRKASGTDSTGAKVFKLFPHIFASNLSKIYNRSIEMGEYPAQIELAKVIALFKKGNKL